MPESATLQLIKDVIKLYEAPGTWTQNWAACDAQGHPTAYNGSKAVCWCLLGALGKESSTYSIHYRDAADLISSHIPESIVTYNDHCGRTQEEVVAMLKDVVESEKD